MFIVPFFFNNNKINMRLLFLTFFSIVSLSIFCQDYELKNISSNRTKLETFNIDNSVYFVGGNESSIIESLNTISCEFSVEDYSFDGFTSSKKVSTDKYEIFYDLSGVNSMIIQALIYDKETNDVRTITYPEGPFQDLGNAISPGGDSEVWFFDEDDQDGIYILNPNNLEWVYSEFEIPFSRREMNVIKTENKIFFLGGKNSFSSWSNQCDVFVLDSGEWEEFTLSEPKNNFQLAIVDNKIVIAGGVKSNSNSDRSVETIEVIDVETYNVETYPMSEARNFSTVVSVGNEVIFAGGNTKYAEIFNIDSRESRVEDFNVEFNLENLASGRVGNKVVLGGGNSVDGNKLFIYDGLNSIWSDLELGSIKNNINFIELNDKLYLSGGSSSEVLIFEDNFISTVFDESAENVVLFPNPTSSFFSIEDLNNVESVDIYSLQGRLIKSYYIEANMSENIFDVSFLDSAVYIVRITSKSKHYTSNIYIK